MGAEASSSSSFAGGGGATHTTAAAAGAQGPLAPILPAPGADTANGLSRELELYAIRLQPEQSLSLYGLLRPKRTLTWRDVLDNRRITLRGCVVTAGVPADKLHRMQPDIKEWIRHGRTTIADAQHMGPWRPHAFDDFGCNIGDLIVYRQYLTPQMLIDAGIDFRTMRNRYGLTAELMIMLKYSADDWVRLRIDAQFVSHELSDEHWRKLFGLARRSEILAQLLAAAAPTANAKKRAA